MNLPKTVTRKENLIQDLESKSKFLERKQENLRMEIEKIDQKVERLRKTKSSYLSEIEEMESQQVQLKRDLEKIRSLQFEQKNQEPHKGSLENLYRDNESLRGIPKEKLPKSLLLEYNL